jgi:hypothetical protein
MISPAAASRRIRLEVNPHHPVVKPGEPLYGALGLIGSGLPPAWEEVDIDVGDAGLPGELDARGGVRVEGPVGVPGTDDRELDPVRLQALHVR